MSFVALFKEQNAAQRLEGKQRVALLKVVLFAGVLLALPVPTSPIL
jgi:hypothetical protein